MNEQAGCFGMGLMFLVIWFVSSALMAFIVQWVLSWFGVHLGFWPCFGITLVFGFLFGGHR